MKKFETKKSKIVKTFAAPAVIVANPEKIAPTPVANIAKPEKAVAAPVAEVVKPVQPAPAKKPAAQTTRTTIEARIDVGFGNALYIRGEGPGLSWDKGLVMDCVADAQWIVTISDAVGPIVFKFLVNDVTWCVGTDYSVESGASITLEPTF
jgi:hypothetical protein